MADTAGLETEHLERLTVDAVSSSGFAETRAGNLLLSVAGPAGAGKSTVVAALSPRHATVLESVEDNPYLANLNERHKGGFSAADNQRWFLRRACDQLAQADSSRVLIVDQDPVAIVHVYGRQFASEGLLSRGDYRALLVDLAAMGSILARWGRRLPVFLDAPPATLRARARQRGDESVPDLSWFAAIRNRFRSLADEIPQALRIRTDERTVEEVVALVEDHLQR